MSRLKGRVVTSLNELNQLNVAEARGWIIDRLLSIEHNIDIIIINFFSPDNANVFESILLNSSILDFGSKLKILKNLGYENTLIEKIRRISSIRNGFAHANIRTSFKIEFNAMKVDSVGVDSMIYVMNSQGEIKEKKASDLLKEFWNLYLELRNELLN